MLLMFKMTTTMVFLVWLHQPPVQINICLVWFGFTPLLKRLRETQLQCALTS